jgi:molybdopterin-containing oxidoreductase family membrane subunit
VFGSVILASSILMTLMYAVESFSGWYGGDPAEIRRQQFEVHGWYNWLYAILIFCNVLVPQMLWSPRFRRSPAWVTIISIAVVIGMWIERILIILNTLSHDYMPSSWRIFVPTAIDFLLYFGSIGLFTFLMMMFARVTPAASMVDTRELVAGELS